MYISTPLVSKIKMWKWSSYLPYFSFLLSGKLLMNSPTRQIHLLVVWCLNTITYRILKPYTVGAHYLSARVDIHV